ncbi:MULTISPECIES: hypothetical protein [unclassified Candidatus Tisiphia]|uniref:hypothetical protein n=1 Tax=unclassified Candidatus Tisiphia TaxID=2996318 RepID=UPI00312CC0AA
MSKQVNWYDKPENFNNIVEIANKITESYPNSRIFSLGQSPAWFVKAEELLVKASHHSEAIFDYIAFSGKFYKKSELEQEFKKEFTIDKGNEANYRVYLKSINMDPDSIIDSFKAGQQTVIVEYTQMGRGLASFLSVLCNWAKEEGKKELLEDSFKIAILAQDCNEITNIIIPGEVYFQCDKYFVDTELIILMSGDKAGKVDGRENLDRLVPYYPYWKWNQSPTPLENNELVTEIIGELQVSVNEFLSTN